MNATTLGQLIEQSEGQDMSKADFGGTDYRFSINDDCEIVAEEVNPSPFGGVAPMPMTIHALSQLCGRVGSITPSVAINLRNIEQTRPHLSRAFDELRQLSENNTRRSPWFVRAYNGQARAVLTTGYASTPNTELIRLAVEGVTRLAGESGQVVDVLNFPAERSSVTPDHLHLYAGLRNVQVPGASQDGGGFFKLGFTIRNSEIGDGGLKISPYVQRTSCTNSIVFSGNEDFYAIHRGSGRHLMREVVIAIGNALRLSFDGLEMFLNAREVELPNISAEIDKLAEKHGWTTEVIASVGAGTEGQHNLFGLVNGITFAAHDQFSDPAERMEMEALAGGLLIERMTDRKAL